MILSRKILSAGIALSAGLALSACAEGDDASGTADTATQETVTTQEATTTTSAESETSAEDTMTTTAADQQAGADPVFGAIEAALAEHPDGIIISVDREDDRETYDIDLVVADEVVELEVDADGAVREDEREREGDDVVDAQNATVTAEDAIRQALDQHPDGVLDEAELDDDDAGALRWEINLDDVDRNDLTELTIPAN